MQMTLISENIKFLRKSRGYTQEQFAEKIEIKRSLVGAYEEGRADPRLPNLIKMAELFGTTVDNLITRDLASIPETEWRKTIAGGSKDILAITVDSEERENVELVPQKAAAGYLNGYADPDFIKDLPRFQLPTLPTNATYRAFEISGDSMLPLVSGTIVIGEYLENVRDIKSGLTYILVTKDEGVVYKRVFNYLDDNGKLFLVSDNRAYEPYAIDGDAVLEIWKSKAYISVEFPDGNDQSDMSADQLAGIVMDLQKEILLLKERADHSKN